VTVIGRPQSRICHVLREDSDLAEAVAPADRDRAISECTARQIGVAAGRWNAHDPAVPDGIGLLVMDGLLIRKVGVEGRYGAELLGEGDLLQPWHEDEPLTLPSTTSSWRVLEQARFAVLDEQFAELLGHYPPLTRQLIGRAIQRSRHLAINMAIVHQARVDVRLHMLFWYFAQRWGRVRGDGVNIPIRLTHSALSDLVAARRPTVTTALSELARRGLVRAVDDGWLLAGEPPGELLTKQNGSLQTIS
jgi:hypothetical protein